MKPKSAKRFWGHVMLKHIGIDHVHDFGSIRSKVIAIEIISRRDRNAPVGH